MCVCVSVLGFHIFNCRKAGDYLVKSFNVAGIHMYMLKSWAAHKNLKCIARIYYIPFAPFWVKTSFVMLAFMCVPNTLNKNECVKWVAR